MYKLIIQKSSVYGYGLTLIPPYFPSFNYPLACHQEYEDPEEDDDSDKGSVLDEKEDTPEDSLEIAEFLQVPEEVEAAEHPECPVEVQEVSMATEELDKDDNKQRKAL